MVDIQAVFNKVIGAGYYPDLVYMCHALEFAEAAGVISSEESAYASECIAEYLGPYIVLQQAVDDPNSMMGTAEWAEKCGVPFYRNWAGRPTRERIVSVQVAPVVYDGYNCEAVEWDDVRPSMWSVYRRYADGQALVAEDYRCPVAAMAYACFISSTHGVPVEAGVPMQVAIMRERYHE